MGNCRPLVDTDEARRGERQRSFALKVEATTFVVVDCFSFLSEEDVWRRSVNWSDSFDGGACGAD